MATQWMSVQGGERLKKKLAEIVARLDKGGAVNVGFLEDATYASTGKGSGPLPVAQVAFWNEYGTSRSPARPFFRTMIARSSPKWGRAMAKNAKATNYNSETTLRRMGEGIQGDLRHSINEWSSPPNAPSTIAKKGFNKPLIHTAHMIRSVDYQVVTDES